MKKSGVSIREVVDKVVSLRPSKRGARGRVRSKGGDNGYAEKENI